MLHEALARVVRGDSTLSNDERFKSSRRELKEALIQPTRRTDRLPWVYFLLATAALNLKDSGGLDKAVQAAISADASIGNKSGWGAAAAALVTHE
jgi:hypothetical protein